MVRCKFRCHYQEKYYNKDTGELTGALIKMSPVYSGSEENKQFFNATPSGEINFYSVNPAVVEEIQEGEEYYVDIYKFCHRTTSQRKRRLRARRVGII